MIEYPQWKIKKKWMINNTSPYYIYIGRNYVDNLYLKTITLIVEMRHRHESIGAWRQIHWHDRYFQKF